MPFANTTLFALLVPTNEYLIGPDKNGYYHELCVRGHSKLTYDIPRLAKKSVERKSKNAALSKSAVLRFNQMPLPPARSEISRGLTAEELPYDRAQDPQLERSSAGICQPARIVQNQPSCQSYSIEAQRPNQCHSHFPMSAVPSPHHRVSFGLGMQPTVQDLFSLDQLRPRPDSGTLPYTMSVRDRLLRAQILMLIGNRSC